MKIKGTVKKPYLSRLRSSQAESTRLAVLGAAGRLFIDRGYVGTTVEAIAVAAGVSRATVFAYGRSKPALLKAAYDVALVGDAAAVPLADRPQSRLVQAEADPIRFLAGYAGISTDVSSRIAAIYEAVREAAAAQPEVGLVWEKILDERRIGAANVVRMVAERHALGAGLDPVAAADIVWVFNDPGLYFLIVHRRGWTHERFTAWLATALQRELL